MRAVLQRAQDNNLRLNKSKRHIQQEEVKYHGHVFAKYGLRTNPEKFKTVVEFKTKVGVQRVF